MTFKHGNITATILPDGNVRLANQHDTLMVERADLDDAITALCMLRQRIDPLGYLRLVEEQLTPRATISEVEWVPSIGAAPPMCSSPLRYLDPAEAYERLRVKMAAERERYTGTVSAEGRLTTVTATDDPNGESLAQQIGRRLRGEVDAAARSLRDEMASRFDHTVKVDCFYIGAPDAHGDIIEPDAIASAVAEFNAGRVDILDDEDIEGITGRKP